MNSICISITALSSVLLFHTKYFINQSIDPSSLRAKHQQRRKSELKADMFKHWNCKSLQTSSYQDHHFAVFSFLLIYLLQHFLHPRHWTVSVHTQYNDCHKIQWNRSPTIYNLQAHLHPLRISPEFHFCETVIPPSFPPKIPQYLPPNTQGFHHCRPREQVWLSVFPFSAAMTSVQVSRRCITWHRMPPPNSNTPIHSYDFWLLLAVYFYTAAWCWSECSLWCSHESWWGITTIVLHLHIHTSDAVRETASLKIAISLTQVF